jgi:cyclase
MVLQRKTGLQEIAPGVWAMILSIIEPEGGGPNSGFIVAGDEVIVVDSLISLGTAREFLGQITSITGREPTFLINTHSHGDHVSGNQIFAPPAKIIAHESVREVLLHEGDSIIERTIQMQPTLAEDLNGAKISVPDITYRAHMTLHFGRLTIELIHPGKAHSLGDTIVYLPEEKILYAGDLLFNHIFPPIFGDSAGWIAAIEQIESMDIEYIVPGHGFICTKQEVTDLKHCLIELREQVKKHHDRNLDKEEALSEIDIGAYRKWPHQERLELDVDQIYREFEREKR